MSRKYHHRGYRDSERDEERVQSKRAPRKELTPEERIQMRSLRHAIDRNAREVVRCHACGRSVDYSGGISPETECPHCRAPLHCCRACSQFDTSARWQCRAEISEAITDKNRANRCAKYQARLVLDSTGRRSGTQGTDDPRSQFDSLFKR
jgi:hypothetical protein